MPRRQHHRDKHSTSHKDHHTSDHDTPSYEHDYNHDNNDPSALLHLPGNHLEGGGQILRNALALSVLTSRPLHITHIRGNRPGGGGLKKQHLASVLWLQSAFGSSHSPSPYPTPTVGSKSISIHPTLTPDPNHPWWVSREEVYNDEGDRAYKRYVDIDVGSNGAAMLVFQAVFPVLVFTAARYLPYKDQECVPRPITLRIKGGTNVSQAPSWEYTMLVLIPMLERLTGWQGVRREGMRLRKRGWNGSNDYGEVWIDVIPLRYGEGIRGFTIAEGEKRERVVKVSLTIVVPTEEELEVWERVGRELVSAVKWDDDHDQTEDLETNLANLTLNSTPEITLTTFSEATLPHSPLPSHLASIDARSYFVLIHVTTTSGYLLGYDNLVTLPSSSSFHSSIPSSKKPKHKKHTQSHNKYTDRETLYTNHATTVLSAPLQRLYKRWKAGALVDEYLEDQLVIWQALADGWSCVSPRRRHPKPASGTEGTKREEGNLPLDPSLHTKTARWVAESIGLVKFTQGENGGTRCFGMGLKAGDGAPD